MFESRIRANDVLFNNVNGDYEISDIIIVVLSEEPFTESEREKVKEICLTFIDKRKLQNRESLLRDDEYYHLYERVKNFMYFLI